MCQKNPALSPAKIPANKNKKIIILEEIFNSVTHGIGTILSIIGFIALLLISRGDAVKITGVSIFGVSLVMMYVMSTLFHSLAFTKAKKVFSVFDKSSVFLLIAGTYTPFALLVLHRTEGIILLTVIWSLAICGIVLHSVFVDKFHKASVFAYLFMGWIGLFVLKPLLSVLSIREVILLVAGGFLYTTGIIFYRWRKLPFNHTIWHIFVLGGSICHFLIICTV